MSQNPVPNKGTPLYRLLIPTVQLSILAQYFPSIKVLEAHGRGNIFLQASHQDVMFKGAKIGEISVQPTGPATLDFVWNQQTGPINIKDLQMTYSNFGVVDISLYNLTFYRMMNVKGQTTPLYLKFGKDTVHKQVYENLVRDGAFPLQQTYQVYSQVKKNLKQQGLSPDVLKRYRPSCLVLFDIAGHKDMLYDAKQIWALKLPNMWLIEEIYKRWEIYDYAYQIKGITSKKP